MTLRSLTVGVIALCLAISAATASAQDLYVLNRDADAALKVTGGGRIDAPHGSIVFSSSLSAVVLTGQSQITGGVTDIVGGYRLTGGSQFVGGVATGVNSPSDPLLSLATPQIGPFDFTSVTVKRDTTLNPGTYGSLSVQSGTATLNPGTYVFTKGLKVSGGRLVSNGEVFMFFGPGAGVALSGAAVVDLTPPSTGTYAGISMFFDRASSAGFSSSGPVPASQRHIDGTVYVASGAVVAHPLDAGAVVAGTVNVPDGGTLNLTG